MKIAIVHDDLVRKGGAEQVALSFHNAFPEAPIYTLSYDADSTYPEFKECNIKTSWFGKLIKKEDQMKRLFFPFGVMAMKQLHLKGYDVILQSTTHCAKYIKADKNALVITYCHTPFRLAWNPDSYEAVNKSGFVKKTLYNAVISMLKKIDEESARRSDLFIANSSEVVDRIKAAYQPKREISVIFPSVKCNNFLLTDDPKPDYLMVSRFESYKKVDLVIEAFNSMPDKRLTIVGKGSREKELKALAKDNITFRSGLSASELATLYANCKALIFPQLEDYGITPLEANASGRPVIAFGKGGVLDTCIPYQKNASKATSVFFSEQTVESLKTAINTFETLIFDSNFIRKHAESFDENQFVSKIRSFVSTAYINNQVHN
ncbi:glycosyltransferase [Mucilaginibacter agri]|uniref:Glycosyltransferase n=1 Tax=Mucilaginibacter agri TaxID=2695265 RepID=A0A965ZLY1_9SPHI|nr:glycosyltransferase [Mucilaginibacter agri]NCD72403.1 glycosyltransferase [Mucilaginibacter agri]